MKGLLIVVSGPSGAGKGTILKKVLEQNSNIKSSVSVTTRAPRQGEVDGVNYFFKSVDEYKEMLHYNQFLEHEEVYGNLYGTPLEYVDNLRNNGYDVVLEIDTKGAFKVKQKDKDAVTIFLTPKDGQILKERLIGRNTECTEELEVRLMSARTEIAQATIYDYLIINDDADKCCEELLTILKAEKLKVSRNINFLKSLI